MPQFNADILVFKCFERYCNFELRVPLRIGEKDFIGQFSELEIHKCLIKTGELEKIWIIEPKE